MNDKDKVWNRLKNGVSKEQPFIDEMREALEHSLDDFEKNELADVSKDFILSTLRATMSTVQEKYELDEENNNYDLDWDDDDWEWGEDDDDDWDDDDWDAWK